jgi:hypothetical protein
VPVKHPEAVMSPEQRRREVAALLGLAVRRLTKRSAACVMRSLEHGRTSEHGHSGEHPLSSGSPLDGAEDDGRDRPLPVGLALGDDGDGP